MQLDSFIRRNFGRKELVFAGLFSFLVRRSVIAVLLIGEGDFNDVVRLSRFGSNVVNGFQRGSVYGVRPAKGKLSLFLGCI